MNGRRRENKPVIEYVIEYMRSLVKFLYLSIQAVTFAFVLYLAIRIVFYIGRLF